jgi:hypothetical protein
VGVLGAVIRVGLTQGEIVDAVAGGDVVGRVLAFLGGGEVDSGVTVEGGEDVAGVRGSRLVLVGDDDHVPAVQWRRVDEAPFSCALWRDGRDDPEGLEGVHVLLPLDYVHGFAGGDSSADVAEPVQLDRLVGAFLPELLVRVRCTVRPLS